METIEFEDVLREKISVVEGLLPEFDGNINPKGDVGINTGGCRSFQGILIDKVLKVASYSGQPSSPYVFRIIINCNLTIIDAIIRVTATGFTVNLLNKINGNKGIDIIYKNQNIYVVSRNTNITIVKIESVFVDNFKYLMQITTEDISSPDSILTI